VRRSGEKEIGFGMSWIAFAFSPRFRPAPKQRRPKNIDVNTSDVSVQFQGFRALSLHHQKLKVSEKCQGMSMPEMIGVD
jgi:hypothetical protein